MRKKMLFSMMFMAGIAGGLVTFPSQAMASVTQSLLLILTVTLPSMSLQTAFL